MPKLKVIPTKEERALAKKIVSESTGVVITFGRTNGQTVLHANGFTLRDESDWSICPLNSVFQKASQPSSIEREKEVSALHESIANRDAA